MKAVVYNGPNLLEYKEVEDVFPKENEVKIKIRASGICGSDVHGYQGLTGRRIPPVIMGHEFAGEVVELGSNSNNLKIGDRVAVYPLDFCGECEMCLKGDVHLCLNKRAFGVLDVDGAYAEYICVPEKVCFKLNDNIPYLVGSLMEPLAVSYRGVNHVGDLKDKTVLIIGAGTIGLLAMACVQLENPKTVIVANRGEYKLEVAKEMGADILINTSNDNFDEAISNATNGQGVDVVIEAVGIQATVNQGIDALGFGGTAVWLGLSAKDITIDMQKVVTKELVLKGSFLYGLEEFKTMVNVLNENKLDLGPIISKSITLDQVPNVMQQLAENSGKTVKVTVVNED